MKEHPRTPTGQNIAAKWDGMNFMERLKLIMKHEDWFWAVGLITRSELAALHQVHESEREYDAEREDQPFFAGLNIKQTLAAQIHRDKLKAALKAVFK